MLALCFVCFSTTATVSIVEQDIIVAYRENVSIECTLPDDQQAEFTWIMPPDSTSIFSIATTVYRSILMFTANKDDSGEYTCQTDFNGNTSVNVTVGKCSCIV